MRGDGVEGGGGADAAVDEEVAEGGEFGRVRDVGEGGVGFGELVLDGGVLLVVFFDDEGGGVAEFAHVLQGLEDVLFGFFAVAAGFVGEGFALFFGEVFEEAFLEVGEVAVVVLEDFRGEVVEDFFFEAAEEEGEDLFV